MASDYISGRLKQREAEASRQFAIDTGIGPLWANLCAAIGNLVEEYARQCDSEKAEWSGPFPESIWARVGAMEKSRAPQIRERNRVDVKLDRKTGSVAFRYAHSCHDSRGGEIAIGVNGDGQACFVREDGKPISIEDVARRIVDPFLFADLPPL